MSHKVCHPAVRKEINRTYVISACNNVRSPGTLKLQRRETMVKSSPQVEPACPDKDVCQRAEPEKRLTLQRRPRTGSIENDDVEKNGKSTDKSKPTQAMTSTNDSSGQTELKTELTNVIGKPLRPKSLFFGHRAANPHVNGSSDHGKLQSLKNTKGNDSDKNLRSFGQDVTKTPGAKNGNLENQKTTKSGISGLMRSASTREIKSPAITPKRVVGTLPAVHKKVASMVAQAEKTREASCPSEALHGIDENSSHHATTVDDCHKTENCAVTVAVRVRPFSTREVNEKAAQVVFMNGQETNIQYPDSKQNHSFLYDFSFSSFQKSDPNYASQKKVYEKLAAPLLDWSLLGYNTCLFAYGQTGSGKSYTMMGFGEELGIIPRFCEHLFSQIQTVKQKVSFHLEMSYFEVYNEKIHDLLVFKADNGQKKQPLRVREHPLLGPYVEDLSTNVVSSFQDIQVNAFQRHLHLLHQDKSQKGIA